MISFPILPGIFLSLGIDLLFISLEDLRKGSYGLDSFKVSTTSYLRGKVSLCWSSCVVVAIHQLVTDDPILESVPKSPVWPESVSLVLDHLADRDDMLPMP